MCRSICIGPHNAKWMERVPTNATGAGKQLSGFEGRGVILCNKTVMDYFKAGFSHRIMHNACPEYSVK